MYIFITEILINHVEYIYYNIQLVYTRKIDVYILFIRCQPNRKCHGNFDRRHWDH